MKLAALTLPLMLGMCQHVTTCPAPPYDFLAPAPVPETPNDAPRSQQKQMALSTDRGAMYWNEVGKREGLIKYGQAVCGWPAVGNAQK